MKTTKIRYAVVGLGHIAQAAVLPAFKHAANSELVALVSSNTEKLKALSRKYKIKHSCSYAGYEDLLRSGEIDAVYNALPNHLHASPTIAALNAGVHVLCEKPMAVSAKECWAMHEASVKSGAKLMIAYRLHFEESNLKAVEIAKKQLGEVRLFNSVFAFTPKVGNIRLLSETFGGGPVYDIGVYCINAARYLFQDEPLEVSAMGARNGAAGFKDIYDTVSVMLRFPEQRLASFTVSFSSVPVANYRIVGSKGQLEVDNAYEYAAEITHKLTIGEKTKERTFKKRDQFAAELVYFSNCIRTGKQPEPSALEGLADVRIVEAILESIRTNAPVRLKLFYKQRYPSMGQEMHFPPIKMPSLVGVEDPVDEQAA